MQGIEEMMKHVVLRARGDMARNFSRCVCALPA